MAIHWIRNCVGSHSQCNGGLRSGFFPTRVVDLGSSETIKEPMILERANILEPFVALSHRWGQHGLPKTTLSNISDRKRSLSVTTLSKTMQEVFTVVKKLGFRYVWIDALCIIQDSRDDWLIESAKMSDVFSAAVLTLAVADSDDHSTGLFRPRQARCVRPVRFEKFCLPRKARLWFEGEGVLYLMPSSPKVNKGIRPRGPLDSRGWVLQEQILSPRIPYYGNGELFWDCINLSASESSPVSASLLEDEKSAETWALKFIRRAITGTDGASIDQKYLKDAWLNLVINYTSRNLTYPTDKLVAIEGIVVSIQRIFYEAIAAGLWKEGLWRQLTWWSTSPRPASSLQSDGLGFLAPSWSWLNARGPINYHNSIPHSKGSSEFRELTSSIQVINIRTETIMRESEIQGELTVIGYCFPYLLTPNDCRTRAWKGFHKKTLNKGQWFLDDTFELPLKIECLILAEDYDLKVLVCLCMIPSPKRDDSFCRIGLCHWDGLLHDVERFTECAPTKRKLTIV
jgi:hypothetical protein